MMGPSVARYARKNQTRVFFSGVGGVSMERQKVYIMNPRCIRFDDSFKTWEAVAVFMFKLNKCRKPQSGTTISPSRLSVRKTGSIHQAFRVCFFDDCWTAGYHWVIPLKTRTFVHRKWDNTWWVTRTAWSAWAPRQASKHGSCWVLHLFGWSCFICFALLPDAKKHPNRCLRNNLEQHIITPNTGSVVQNHFHVISFKLLFCW